MNFDDSYIAVGPYVASLEWANDRIETANVDTQVEAFQYVYAIAPPFGTRTAPMARTTGSPGATGSPALISPTQFVRRP